MASWQSFYVIVGSAGASLIGIQFIVITLIANRRQRPSAEALHAFATPTVVHFTGALLISAVMSIPWPSLLAVAVALAMCGIVGLGYCAFVIRRTRRQTDYTPVWQDWLWFTLFPCSAYAALALAAFVLRTKTQTASFVIAAAALGLLLTAIHNSWDSVTHLIVNNPDSKATTSE
jgi:hypothetical protein